MGTMAIIWTLTGVGLLLLVAYDVYATVLHASARFGPVGESLNRTIWRATRRLAFRLRRAGRHRLLNSVGPLLLPLLMAVYIILLVAGFALVYFPHFPAEFNLTAAFSSDWVACVYFSGSTLTTVGYGDITPASNAMRFAAMFESATGLALISLVITYLLSVYAALERKRAIALSLYHQAEEGADAAGYIAHHFVEGRFYGLQEALRWATRDIQSLYEAHVEHPVIHYFHPFEVYKSLPRMLFLLLETCAVIRTCLDEEAYATLRNLPDVRTLEASATHVLTEMIRSLNLERRQFARRESSDEVVRRWRRRYQQTLARLSAHAIQTGADPSRSWEAYRARREDWEAKLHRLASYLGYEWDEITGDRDLEYAADEAREEPRA